MAAGSAAKRPTPVQRSVMRSCLSLGHPTNIVMHTLQVDWVIPSSSHTVKGCLSQCSLLNLDKHDTMLQGYDNPCRQGEGKSGEDEQGAPAARCQNWGCPHMP